MEYKKRSALFALYVTIASTISIDAIPGDNKFGFPSNLIGINTTAAEILASYSRKYEPVDLGKDLLDDCGPLHVRKHLANATLSNDASLNQYAPHYGHPRLMRVIAKMYSQLIGQHLTADENVLVTAGATEATYCAIHGHTVPGDEWIIIEPAYLMYVPMIKHAGGIPRYSPLKLTKTNGPVTGSDWQIDKEQMESLFNNKTKAIMINNPLNPIGKVYSLDELLFIAKLAKKYNVLVICDEAHEFITHKPHIRIASLPGMWERTITIGSASKSFSLSGWRVGWAYGPANILNHLKTAHFRSLDTSATPHQEAIAIAVEEELRDWGKPSSYFENHRKSVQQHRDYLVQSFNDIGMLPVIPEGGFCILANWTTLNNLPLNKEQDSAMDFAQWLIKEIGVLGFPLSTFYSKDNAHLGESQLRYCYHKKFSTLETAVERLQKLKDYF